MKLLRVCLQGRMGRQLLVSRLNRMGLKCLFLRR